MATVRLRNINPLGQVDLPLINRQGDGHLGVEGIGNLEPGEEFDGPDVLLEQIGNYAPADAAAEAYLAAYLAAQQEALDPQPEPKPEPGRATARRRTTAAERQALREMGDQS